MPGRPRSRGVTLGWVRSSGRGGRGTGIPLCVTCGAGHWCRGGGLAMGLPQGTVTFLFTDLEGSTRRWEAHPEQMRDALARHNTIVREAVESHHGVVFSTMGDG